MRQEHKGFRGGRCLRAKWLLRVSAWATVLGVCLACREHDEKPGPEKRSEKSSEPPAPTAEQIPGSEVLRHWPKIDPGASEAMTLDRAVALLQPTEGNQARGTVTFESMGEDGLRIETDVENLPPGRHGYHVHLLGDCTSADGKSAGTHFNFRGPSKHPPEDVGRITGNLGELDANAKGHARHEDVISEATLVGAFSIVGRSVVVHAKPNNLGEPPLGGAGARLACGVIGIAE